MTNLELFPKASHRGEITSQQAEHKHTKSGRRKNDYQRVLEFLSKRPDFTSAELTYLMQNYTDIDLITVRRRLSDAKEKGDAIQTGKRICRVANSPAVTWRCV